MPGTPSRAAHIQNRSQCETAAEKGWPLTTDKTLLSVFQISASPLPCSVCVCTDLVHIYLSSHSYNGSYKELENPNKSLKMYPHCLLTNQPQQHRWGRGAQWQGQNFLRGPGEGLTRLKVGEGKENNVLMTAPVTLKEGLEWKLRKAIAQLPGFSITAEQSRAGNVSSSRSL